ncbi:hypothetical protein AR457_41685 (plasmid) [Streptomyces agglomeratus]|nr:hypothetical protein AR457_41685 [Streptomyces agglomeratus]
MGCLRLVLPAFWVFAAVRGALALLRFVVGSAAGCQFGSLWGLVGVWPVWERGGGPVVGGGQVRAGRGGLSGGQGDASGRDEECGQDGGGDASAGVHGPTVPELR